MDHSFFPRGDFKMTKAELVERVSGQINLTKKQTEVVVNTVFQSITDSLSEGRKVELRGFGSFRVRARNARIGRNPKSGAGGLCQTRHLFRLSKPAQPSHTRRLSCSLFG